MKTKQTNKLFALFVGGRIKKCNIELHDIFFIVSENIEQTYKLIIDKWWGDSYIHLDSYIDLSRIENYQVEICHSQKSEKKLFFINFGSYKKGIFGETHNYEFVVANDKSEAIKKVKESLNIILVESEMIHLDDSLNIDDCIDLSEKYKLNLTTIESCNKLEIVHTNKRLCLDKDNPKYLF